MGMYVCRIKGYTVYWRGACAVSLEPYHDYRYAMSFVWLFDPPTLFLMEPHFAEKPMILNDVKRYKIS